MADIHDRAYDRAKSHSKALRKYHIDRDRAAGRWSLWYSDLHRYDKGKIHCSCPMCSAKTNNKNRSGARGWEPSKNWSIADQKKLNSMENQLENLNDNME